MNSFGKEVINLEIYRPKKFRIYRQDGSKTNGYVFKYNKYKFWISDRPDECYPQSFEIIDNSMQMNLTASSWMEDKTEWELPLIVQIYYQQPEEIIIVERLHNGELLDLASTLDRAKVVLGPDWSFELSFGICVFYYWIRIYYQSSNNIHIYNQLYQMFERNIFNSN